jgi:hypothetical protein
MRNNCMNALKKGLSGPLRSVYALSMVANRKALFSRASWDYLLEADITRNSHQLLAVDAASN